MCGIVVVAGKIEKTEKDVFRQMLIVDALRGPHSTGFVTVKGDNVEVFKTVGDPYMAMEHRGFDRALAKDTNVLIGHNRYATVGKVNRQNAHPFEFPSVVGAHNGTLTNKYALPDHTHFDVDSEALYNSFDVDGVDLTIGKLRGAWSLVWWDKVGKTLNFLRNNERPMAYCLSEDGKTLFAASEGHMLLWILARNSIKHTPINITAVDVHYTLPVENQTEFMAKVLPAPIERPVKGAAPEVFHLGQSGLAGKNTANKVMAVDYINKVVTFCPEVAYSLDGVRFVEGCFWVGDVEMKVLVEVTSNKKLEEDLLGAIPGVDYLDFEGVPYGCRYLDGEQYLLLRAPSIKGKTLLKKSGATANKVVMWPGFQGKGLTMIEWRDKTACGCAYCGHIPIEEEKNTLDWISDKEFHCDSCARTMDLLSVNN